MGVLKPAEAEAPATPSKEAVRDLQRQISLPTVLNSQNFSNPEQSEGREMGREMRNEGNEERKDKGRGFGTMWCRVGRTLETILYLNTSKFQSNF